MPYGRRFRGGELILPTLGSAPVGSSSIFSTRRSKARRKVRGVRKQSKHSRRSSPKKSRRSRGKIYYAKKTGQPYIILANGRAKFIKGKRRK